MSVRSKLPSSLETPGIAQSLSEKPILSKLLAAATFSELLGLTLFWCIYWISKRERFRMS